MGFGFYIEENFYIYKAYHNLCNIFCSLICYFPENVQQICGHLNRSAVDIHVWVPLEYALIFSRMERKFSF